MSMIFEGETLRIGGRSYIGTIYIETEVSDASFSHEFGTELALDVNHYPEGFIADGVSRCMAESIDAEAMPALGDWLQKNRCRVEKAWDFACKR